MVFLSHSFLLHPIDLLAPVAMAALVSLLLVALSVNASPAPRAVPRADTQPCWTTYRSLPGDTCETIAMAFRIPPIDVQSANSFLNCTDIWPNTPICIYAQSQVTVTGIPPVAPTTVPGSGTCWNNYRSQPGDTCNSIASRFGITPEAVYNANTLLNCNDIWDGTPIVICDGNRTRTTVVNTTSGSHATATSTFPWGHVTTSTRAANGTFSTGAPHSTVTATVNTTSLTSPGPSATPTVCWTTYNTLPGETCDTIAMAFRIPPLDVLRANPFLDCNNIPVNTRVCIYGQSQVTVTMPPVAPTSAPGSGTCWANYRSQPGDTCNSIATRFGITPQDVYNANTFLNCDDIWDGTPIAICDGNRTRTTVVNTTSRPAGSTVTYTG